MIRHISFDLWLTLIQSHPEFKMKRAEYFFYNYNPYKYTVEDVFDIIKKIDLLCDNFNVSSGGKIPALLMYEIVLINLGFIRKVIKKSTLRTIKGSIDSLFCEYMPMFINANICDILKSLKNDNFSINLSSNTGFIENKVMKQALIDLGIYKYFSFFLFSDEIGISKPSKSFFKLIHDKSQVDLKEILHIGDNYNIDYLGAINYGMNALQINKNYSLIEIYMAIEKNNKNI